MYIKYIYSVLEKNTERKQNLHITHLAMLQNLKVEPGLSIFDLNSTSIKQLLYFLDYTVNFAYQNFKKYIFKLKTI